VWDLDTAYFSAVSVIPLILGNVTTNRFVLQYTL
jgi:hypothetical protein